MMKKRLPILLFFQFLLMTHFSFGQNYNMTLRSTISYGVSLSNIGGYVDGQGNEYALVGYYEGLSIVNVTDPDNPFIAFTVNGPQSDWREVKTWSTYAYVTTEGGSSGLQIVDLSNLPNSINSKYWKGSGAINNQMETIHALHIDEGYVYLFGSNLFNGEAIIADLADPWNPVYVGRTPSPDEYIHDGYVRNDTLWAGHIYGGYFAVYDVSNKANPIKLAQQTTPNNFTHNTWLNDAGTVLFTTDETNDSYLAAYDITDLGNITELDRFQVTPGSQSIVHNTHILNDFAVTSWYKDGVSITDVSRPGNIIPVGQYDTYPQGTGGGFSGCWGVYPFLPSGTIVASDIDNGLYVLTPNYVRGCYLEGVVVDSSTGTPLNNATVQVLSTTMNEITGIDGVFKTGTVTPGTVTVQVSRSGYITKTITNVSLVNGQLTNLLVELVPFNTFVASGQVVNAVTGQPVAGAIVNIVGPSSNDVVTADANGEFSIPAFAPDNYIVDAGAWGYETYCANNVALNTSTVPLTISLQPAIYDDFTFDLGWTVSGSSGNPWERGEPVGTNLFGAQSNPDVDVNGDCRDKAYVTDNGGGQAGSNDVDGGNAVLTSPVFDATQFLNPYVNYYRWFFNAGGQGNPNDTLTVKLSNGTTTATLETVLNNTNGNGTWISKSYQIAAFITPTNNMRFIIETADYPTAGGHIVEGGLDAFEVVEGPASLNESTIAAPVVFPNPSVGEFTVQIPSVISNGELVVTDIAGRVVEKQLIKSGQSQMQFGTGLSQGTYLVYFSSQLQNSAAVKISKIK
jgi:choice-of-anchor B domain-containing protein